MAALYSLREHGFDARLTLVDRCQVAFQQETDGLEQLVQPEVPR